LVEGGLYVLAGDDGFSIVKILKIENDVIHVRVYSNRYESVPGRIDPTTLFLGKLGGEDPFGIGHQPTRRNTVLSWRLQFLQHSLVEPNELEGYEYWKEIGGGVWD